MSMKRIAIAGFGFMGRMHYGNWKKIPGVRVVAICDANLAQFTRVTCGNLGGADTDTDFTGIAVYDDFGKMLATGGFEAVDITLPTPLHPKMTIAALMAGCHVLCEKPMALSVRDCDRMLLAARRAKRTLLVAHCLRFWPEYVALKRIVDSRRYGQVVAASFNRSTPAPDPKGPHGWFLDESKSGGCLLDMHIHDADMIHFIFGDPQDLHVASHRRKDGLLDHVVVSYSYPDKVVTGTVSWAVAKTLGFEASFHVILERATVVFNSKRPVPLEVYPAVGKPFVPKTPSRCAYEAEQRYFLGLLDCQVDDSMLSAHDARAAVALVSRIAARCRKRAGANGRSFNGMNRKP